MKTIFYLLTISLIFLAFSSKIIIAQTGWQQVTAPWSNTLNGIYFKDINTGVCMGFKTTNGGQNWYYNGLLSTCYAMMFPDQNTGYEVEGGIYKTTDLGENWITQTNPAGGTLYGVYFPDINTGYACGENGNIVKTTNGGENWILLTSPVTSSFYLRGTYFFDFNTGFVSGYETSNYTSVIIKTTSGGANWNMQSFGSNTGYATLFFPNPNTGIVVGATIARTTNAGNSWQGVTDPANSFYRQVYFPSPNIGYAVGFYGIIIKTTNGGETWFRQTTNISSDLQSVYFINDNTGYACGDYGMVLKTVDGGGPPFGIRPISNETPQNYTLFQNYPNPFNPITKINFELPISDYVKLTVYNILGKEIAILVDTRLSHGRYEVNFDGSNYPSGVYFYVLNAGDYAASKKMILVK